MKQKHGKQLSKEELIVQLFGKSHQTYYQNINH
jgi:hypothetical protein